METRPGEPDYEARSEEDPVSAFIPFAGELRDILRVRKSRKVGNDNTVRYENRVLQIESARHRHHFVKAKIRVHEYPDGHLAVFHGPGCIGRYWPDGTPLPQDGHGKDAA